MLLGELELRSSSPWLVGVSGGADSVALLRALVVEHPTTSVVVAHLNHESRGVESDGDADFVRELARSLGVEIVIERLSTIAPIPTRGHEAAYRQARMIFFRRIAAQRGAAGVLLAHHAQDRAETTLLRLLRGGEPWAVGGLRREATVGGLRICRPLISVMRPSILDYLRELNQPWREDASNASGRFARNRVRQFLNARPDLLPAILRLADAADALRAWTIAQSPRLSETFATDALADLPDPPARATARTWLRTAGDDSAGAVAALVEMCRDASTPSRRQFAGGITIRRRGGRIERN